MVAGGVAIRASTLDCWSAVPPEGQGRADPGNGRTQIDYEVSKDSRPASTGRGHAASKIQSGSESLADAIAMTEATAMWSGIRHSQSA